MQSRADTLGSLLQAAQVNVGFHWHFIGMACKCKVRPQNLGGSKLINFAVTYQQVDIHATSSTKSFSATRTCLHGNTVACTNLFGPVATFGSSQIRCLPPQFCHFRALRLSGSPPGLGLLLQLVHWPPAYMRVN